jgi:hypothetical protein
MFSMRATARIHERKLNKAYELVSNRTATATDSSNAAIRLGKRLFSRGMAAWVGCESGGRKTSVWRMVNGSL